MERSFKDRIQEVLLQDFDAVWDGFVLEHGSPDRAAFVRHLLDWTLIPPGLGAQLLAAVAPQEPEQELLDTTTIMSADDRFVVDPEGATQAWDREGLVDHGLLEETLVEERAPTAAAPVRDPAMEIDPEAETLHIDRRALTPAPAPRVDAEPARVDPPPAQRTPAPAPEPDLPAPTGIVATDVLSTTATVPDPSLDRTLHLRTLLPEHAQNPIAVARFERDLRVMAQLDHPGVPSVLGSRGPGTYVLRAHDGRPLASVIAEVRASFEAKRPVPASLQPIVLLERFARACEVVAYAHARGIVHRDLNPQNLLFGSHGGVWVVGWGSARAFGPPADEPVRLDPLDEDARTQTGTPGYCSPEQANGRTADLDARSDVYSLGLLLFELLTLRPAVTGASPSVRLTRQQAAQTDPVVHFYRQPIEPPFHAILATALAVHPADRYASPATLAEDLRRAIRGAPLTGRREGPWLIVGRLFARHPAVVLIVVASLFVAWAATAAALVTGLTVG